MEMSPTEENAAENRENQTASRDVDHKLVQVDAAFAEEGRAWSRVDSGSRAFDVAGVGESERSNG